MSEKKRDKVTVYLKGGASFTLVADEITVTRQGNRLTSIAWKGFSADETRPAYIDLAEVAAVVWAER